MNDTEVTLPIQITHGRTADGHLKVRGATLALTIAFLASPAFAGGKKPAPTTPVSGEQSQIQGQAQGQAQGQLQSSTAASSRVGTALWRLPSPVPRPIPARVLLAWRAVAAGCLPGTVLPDGPG